MALEFLKGRETISLVELKYNLNIGDNMAGRLMDKLEEYKYVESFNGNINRKILKS